MDSLEVIYRKILANGGHPFKNNLCIVAAKYCRECPIFPIIGHNESCWTMKESLLEKIKKEIRKEKLRKLLS